MCKQSGFGKEYYQHDPDSWYGAKDFNQLIEYVFKRKIINSIMRFCPYISELIVHHLFNELFFYSPNLLPIK